MKEKYATPVPSTIIFTKSDCSPTYSKVVELQQEFGFEYAAVVGSLIYLMNTYTRLNHSIRKLARFMQYPGRTHFNLLLHLLCHLQCHRLRGGIKFYADIDITKAPLYKHPYSNRQQQVCRLPNRGVFGRFLPRLPGFRQINRRIPHFHARRSCGCYLYNATTGCMVYLRSGILYGSISCNGSILHKEGIQRTT
jgi:hypothetical protein